MDNKKPGYYTGDFIIKIQINYSVQKGTSSSFTSTSVEVLDDAVSYTHLTLPTNREV